MDFKQLKVELFYWKRKHLLHFYIVNVMSAFFVNNNFLLLVNLKAQGLILIKLFFQW